MELKYPPRVRASETQIEPGSSRVLVVSDPSEVIERPTFDPPRRGLGVELGEDVAVVEGHPVGSDPRGKTVLDVL